MIDTVMPPEFQSVDSQPAMRRLPPVLNASFMGEFWRRHFRQSSDPQSGALLNCRVLGKYYRPGAWLVVAFALDFAGRREPLQLFLQAPASGNTEPAPDEFRSSGAEWIPELRARYWRFPNDPELKELPGLLEAGRVRQLFQQNANGESKEKGGCPWTIRTLNYVPLKRCAALFEAERGAGDKGERLVGKVDIERKSRAVFSVMEQLWSFQSKRQTSFSVVRPIDFDDENHILWQEWSPGTDFLQFAQVHGLRDACARAARGLADLHQTPLQGVPNYSDDELLGKLRQRAHCLAAFHPKLEAPLSRLLDRLIDCGALRAGSPKAPMHGDFNGSQVLFRDGKPVILDFESVKIGDPLYDVAHFVVGLYALKTPWRLAAAEVAQAAGEFLRSYKQAVPWRVSDTAYRAQVAAAFISRRAHKALTHLEAGTEVAMEYYVSLAGRYLDRRES